MPPPLAHLAALAGLAVALAACTEGVLGEPPSGGGNSTANGNTSGGATGSGAMNGGAGGGGAMSGSGGGAMSGSGGGPTAGTGGEGGTGTFSIGPLIGPACPFDMVHVPTGVDAAGAPIAGYCVDRYEAPNEPGQEPLVMQSALLGEAWCNERGRRLCTEDEWQRACRGPDDLVYPYGDTHEAERCNDARIWKAPNEGVLATWPSAAAQAEVDKLYQASPSGTLPGCESGYGAFDMTGNVEEWVVRSKPHVNNYDHILVGCYWAGCYGGSKPTCGSTNSAHADAFMFYETGFRCCSDAY